MRTRQELFGRYTTKVGGNACRSETVIENCFYDYFVTFNIVVNRKREMRYSHTMMSVENGMDSRLYGKFCESAVDVVHEMLKNPCAVRCIEVLGFDEVEFRKNGKAYSFGIKEHVGVPEAGLLLLPSRKRAICLRHRVSRVGRVRLRARLEGHMRMRPFRATATNSPSFGLFQRHSSHQSVEVLQA